MNNLLANSLRDVIAMIENYEKFGNPARYPEAQIISLFRQSRPTRLKNF